MEARQKRLLVKQPIRHEANSPKEIAKIMCNALGISTNEETDSEMFRKIAEKSLKGEGITSKALSKELKIPRSTVIYKLNYFINAGLIVRHGRQYFLKGLSLEDTIEELEAEMQMEFARLLKLASKFDELIESEVYGRKPKEQ